MNPPAESGLRCPDCLGRLRRDDRALACESCGALFPSVWGIPDFSRRKDYYYSPCPQAWLDEALRGMAPGGDAPPVEDFLRDLIDRIPISRRKQEWVENLVDESRAAFKLLLAPRPDGHLLNLGCGWDETSRNLARSWGRVTAIDLTRDRIQVLDLKERGREDGRVELAIGGDRDRLPFADDLFDAVCMNGVLEWVAADWSEVSAAYAGRRNRPARLLLALREVLGRRNPRRRQLAFLREVRRVLRPGGQLYVGIENRFGREYFRGRPDHHSRLLFGSLYPRLVAHLVSLVRSHRPYLTYTYSRSGYRKLLAEAGFPEAVLHAVEPDYRQPEAYVELDDRRAVAAHQRSGFGRRRSLPGPLYAETAPSFAIVAGDGGQGPSQLEVILAGVSSGLGLAGDAWRGKRTLVNRKCKATVLGAPGGPGSGLVVKIPLVPLAERRLRANAAALRAMDDGLPGDSLLRDLLPRPLLDTTIAGLPVFVESALPGRPWAGRPRGDDAALLRQAATLAGAISAVPAGDAGLPSVPASDPERAAWLGALTERLDPELRRVLERVRKLLAGHAGPPVLRKGDGSLSNVLVSGNSISGLIDWDDSVLTPYPLSGLTDLLFSWAWHRRRGRRAETLVALLGGDAGPLAELDLSGLRAAFAEGLAAAGGTRDRTADAPHALALAALDSWLGHAAQELEHPAFGFSSIRVQKLLAEPCHRAAPLLDALEGLS